MDETAPERTKSRRGFAVMARERVRELASIAGKAAHQKGTAHVWTSEEARVAGAKGGKAAALSRIGKPKPQCCGRCRAVGHNAKTCTSERAAP